PVAQSQQVHQSVTQDLLPSENDNQESALQEVIRPSVSHVSANLRHPQQGPIGDNEVNPELIRVLVEQVMYQLRQEQGSTSRSHPLLGLPQPLETTPARTGIVYDSLDSTANRHLQSTVQRPEAPRPTSHEADFPTMERGAPDLISGSDPALPHR
ncbi:hypothetical protein FOZ62_022075, partial [Perkinsus olseni]